MYCRCVVKRLKRGRKEARIYLLLGEYKSNEHFDFF